MPTTLYVIETMIRAFIINKTHCYKSCNFIYFL